MVFDFLTETVAGMENPSGFANANYGSPVEIARVREFLKSQGIEAIVCLLEKAPEDQRRILEQELEYVHIPLADFEAPTIQQMNNFVGFVKAKEAESKKVVIHCNAGCGRTGTMLAAYLISQGYSLQGAIDMVRANRGVCFENEMQYIALSVFYQGINSKNQT